MVQKLALITPTRSCYYDGSAIRENLFAAAKPPIKQTLVCPVSWHWTSCRELFHAGFRGQCFLHSTTHPENVIAFIKRAERILELPRQQKLKIRRTDNDHILFIGLSEFWSVRIRTQLLTILLRAGKGYNTKDFWLTAMQDPYLKVTSVAFRRFMAGNTESTLRGGGWRNSLANKSAEQINQLFREPNGSKTITLIDAYSVYKPQNEQFGLVKKVDKSTIKCATWYACREEFHDEMSYTTSDDFLYITDDTKKTIAFIGQAQKILKLRKKDQVKISKTDRKNVILVKMSRFWRHKFRQQLLTILCRASKNYNQKPKSFWRHAEANKYIKPTKLAFRRFMKGYVRITKKPIDDYDFWFEGEEYGWVDNFETKNRDKINKWFKKPK